MRPPEASRGLRTAQAASAGNLRSRESPVESSCRIPGGAPQELRRAPGGASKSSRELRRGLRRESTICKCQALAARKSA
eukprot:13544031-Alexandrium_andersonii.AAC.1